nr:MAG TPA: hypothetical protein [Crassvirales sp.]
MYELRMFSYCFYYSYTVFFKYVISIMYLVFIHIFLFPVKCYQSLKEVLFVFIFSMLINVEVLSVLYI